jgi:hypothetical protein
MIAEGTLYRLVFPGLELEEIAAGFTDEQPPVLSWVQ